MTDFKDITYLQVGNERQKNVFRLLKKYAILEQLREFDPIVVGTIPIDIDIESSDVDIVLYSENLDSIMNVLKDCFFEYESFHIEMKYEPNQRLICNFFLEGMPFELYAMNIPTEQQAGYIHLLKEFEILQRENSVFRKKIIDLKRKGMKTEPAFCLLLGLTGDNPYQELLQLDIEQYYYRKVQKS